MMAWQMILNIERRSLNASPPTNASCRIREDGCSRVPPRNTLATLPRCSKFSVGGRMPQNRAAQFMSVR